MGGGRVRQKTYYSAEGNNDYALISDFDIFTSSSANSDRIQLVGSSQNYSLSNVNISGISGTGIFLSEDELIAIVQGINASSLNLNDSNHFQYV